MQASSCTAIAGCERSAAGRAASAAKREVGEAEMAGPAGEIAVASRASAPPACRPAAVRTPCAAPAPRARWRCAPPSLRAGCGCRRRRGRAPPPPPPGRRGNCRPGDSRAAAGGRDAGSRCRARVAAAQMVSPGAASTARPSRSEAGHGDLPPGKKRSRLRTGFIAAWPRPQIEPSRHGLGQFLQQRAIPDGRVQQRRGLGGADAAGRALAAAFVAEEAAAGCAPPRPGHPPPPAPPRRRSRRSSPPPPGVPKSSGRSASAAGRMPPEAPPGR